MIVENACIYGLKHAVHGKYIGMTTNLPNRLRVHKHYLTRIYNSDWEEWEKIHIPFDRIPLMELKEIETELISTLQPNLNRYKKKPKIN